MIQIHGGVLKNASSEPSQNGLCKFIRKHLLTILEIVVARLGSNRYEIHKDSPYGMLLCSFPSLDLLLAEHIGLFACPMLLAALRMVALAPALPKVEQLKNVSNGEAGKPP